MDGVEAMTNDSEIPMPHHLNQKITDMMVWHLELPVHSRRDHGIGSVAGGIEVIVVRLTSEGGSQGFGEASPWVVFTGSVEASIAALDRYIRPLVVGQKIGERAKIMAKVEACVAHCTEAKAAIDMALLDLTGHIYYLPVWALIGGKVRDKIPLSVSIANPDFDADIALMERLREDGVGTVKLKAGFRDLDFDTMRMERIRTDYPQFKLRIDYNQGLAIEDAIPEVALADQFDPDFIEQPVAAAQWAKMAQIRQAIKAPLIADESVFSPADMARAVDQQICDGISVKLMKSGSIAHGQSIARFAASNGLMAYGGDMFETGLAHLAGIHMIAATEEITLGCEFYQSTYYLVEDILESALSIKDGHILVPNEKGLGIGVDMDKLAFYAINKAGQA